MQGEQMLCHGVKSLNKLNNIKHAKLKAVINIQLNSGVNVIN